MNATLMMSAKLATPGLLKIKVSLNEGYGVIIAVHEVTKKILSRELNYTAENNIVKQCNILL